MLPPERIKIARQKLSETGRSPRQLGVENRRLVLDWVYRWGATSSGHIQQLLQRTSGGYAESLVRKKLLVKTASEAGLPRHFYTLSRSGLEEAERFSAFLLPYPELNAYRYNQNLLRHNLLAQQVTLNALNKQAIVGYESEKQLQQGDQRGEKRPDVVWHLASGAKMAVEIELSAKWQVRLDQFVDHVIGGLDPDRHDGAPPFARFVIVSDSRVLLERYRQAMQPGQLTARCERDAGGRLYRAEAYTVPGWVNEKVSFLLLE